MPNWPFSLSNFVNGFLETEIPSIARGIFVQLLRKVSIQEAVDWVNSNHYLWDQIDQEHREQIMGYAPRIHDWSWLTSDWLIENLASDVPHLSSLFLGWDEGRAWLDRQIADLKQQAGVQNSDSEG